MSKVRIVVDVDVHDEQLLNEYVEQRWKECLGPPMEDPIDVRLPVRVLEALVLSNENPSPDEYGIQIGDCRSWVLGVVD